MTMVQDQIVRTYSGQSRDAALEAYRLDAARALGQRLLPDIAPLDRDDQWADADRRVRPGQQP